MDAFAFNPRPVPVTTAYVDAGTRRLTVVNTRGQNLRTPITIPARVAASNANRQAEWARDVLTRVGFKPNPLITESHPYGILGIPLS